SAARAISRRRSRNISGAAPPRTVAMRAREHSFERPMKPACRSFAPPRFVAFSRRCRVANSSLRCALPILVLIWCDVSRAQVVIVSSDFNDSVQMYNFSGTRIGAFVPTGGGGLDSPQGITVGPDGDVYVSSANTDQVLHYAPDGTPLGQFQHAGGLDQPWFVTFGPDHNLYVSTSLTRPALCYYGVSGDFPRVAAQGHGLLRPDGLSFDRDGNLIVSDFAAASGGRVQKFNPQTGQWIADVIADPGLVNPLQNRLSDDGSMIF